MGARIHITGASGSGTSTLASALADRLGYAHLDTDAFYWMPTDPPFTTKRPAEDRLALMRAEIDQADGWVNSGSLIGWGDPLVPLFDLVVFLYVPPDVRLVRLREREGRRYGADILPGGWMEHIHRDLIEWAQQYDDPAFSGRTLARHRRWLATLECPVVEISGTPVLEDSIQQVLCAIRRPA